jgi:hypothetical protein
VTVRVWFVCFVALVNAAAAQTPAQDVTIRTSLDRTAIWVADRLTYTIEITCTRAVEILADDLSRDKLKLEGLEVIGGDTDRSSVGDDTIYTLRYVLTTYRIDAPALTIAPMTVRYAVRRAGQRLEDAAPAGEVTVPGARIAFRSVLPDDEDASGIRSDKPPHARPSRFSALQPIGLGLVIVSVVPALLAIAAAGRRSRQPRFRRSARAVRHGERAALEAVRELNVETVDGRREAFTQVDALVRAHLRDVYGVPGASLTPQDVASALSATDGKVPIDLVASIFAACELARYAPPHAIPSAEACRAAIEQVEQVIADTGARGFQPSGRRSP